MSKTDTLSIRLSPETRAELDFIAKSTKRSKSFLGGEAIARFIRTESEIVRNIHQALAEAAAGETVEHEHAMRAARAAIKTAAKRKNTA